MVPPSDHYEQLGDVEERGLLRRLAGARGPSPRVALLGFVLLAGTVCYLESVKPVQSLTTSPLSASQLAAAPKGEKAQKEAPVEPSPKVISPLGEKGADEPWLGFHHWKLVIILSIVFVICVGIWAKGAHLLGLAIRDFIQSADQKMLGTDVTVTQVTLHPCTLKIKIRNLVVENPKPFKAKYLLTVDKFTVDVNMRKLLCSRGKEIEIDKFVCEKVDAIIEYDSMLGPLMGSNSNLQSVLDHMEKNGPKPGEKPPAAKPATSKPEEKPAENQSPCKVTIKELKIIDVGAKLETGLMDPRVAIADINFDNFTKETGGSYAEEIVCIIFKSIGKSILADIVGKRAADRIA